MGPEPKRFARLVALGTERVRDVTDRLRRGETATDVARVIQEDWHELTDIKLGSVKKMLERYRETVVKDEVIAKLTKQGTSVAQLKKKLNAMDELEELARVQKGRFEKMLTKEAQGPLLMKVVSDEARLLKDTLIELGRLQLETGVIQRAPKKLTGQVVDPMTGEVRTFSWTEEQEELVKVIEAQVDEIIYQKG